MKNLVILLMLGTSSAFATQQSCSVECDSNFKVTKFRRGFKEALNAVSAERIILDDLISINPRSKRYSNDSVKCTVLDKNGEEFYSHQYSVTYLAQYYHSQDDKRELGRVSNSIKKKKEDKMKKIISAQLDECNQNN